MRARHAFARQLHANAVPADWQNLPLTRSHAKELGETMFWTGLPCERAGHIERRKTSSSGCWACEYGDQRKKIDTDPAYRELRLKQQRERYANNSEEYLAKQRQYKKNDRTREWYREWYANKRRTDSVWKISKSLRDRLYKAVTRDDKYSSAITLLGCSLSELQQWLERQFTEGMTWENYGDWHIDHIRPCISFDLSSLDEQRQCFHFTNLRPLWADENRSKGGRWNGFDPRRRPRSADDQQGSLFDDVD